MKDKVIIYSAVWCGFCHQAKQYLDSIGVKYEDNDVDKDPKALEDAVNKSGQRGIPVLDIDGDIIIGFDRPKIDAALKTHKLIAAS
jgi:glutaredoxin-like YruB-family protein